MDPQLIIMVLTLWLLSEVGIPAARFSPYSLKSKPKDRNLTLIHKDLRQLHHK